MPEAINPAEGYMANWNNKAATADDGDNFGRQFRHIFILERLAAETAWDRDKQRQLNEDVAGLDGRGELGRYPRCRACARRWTRSATAATPTSTRCCARSRRTGGAELRPLLHRPGRTTPQTAGEVAFLNQLVNDLAQDIYGDEYAGAVAVPAGARALEHRAARHRLRGRRRAGRATRRRTPATTSTAATGASCVRDALARAAPARASRADGAAGEPLQPSARGAASRSSTFPTTPAGQPRHLGADRRGRARR